jgi:hypothetical protein
MKYTLILIAILGISIGLMCLDYWSGGIIFGQQVERW